MTYVFPLGPLFFRKSSILHGQVVGMGQTNLALIKLVRLLQIQTTQRFGDFRCWLEILVVVEQTISETRTLSRPLTKNQLFAIPQIVPSDVAEPTAEFT